MCTEDLVSVDRIEKESFSDPYRMDQYEYELNEAIRCLDQGAIDNDKYSLCNTISVLKWAEQMEIY